jgi:hypothetical protein
MFAVREVLEFKTLLVAALPTPCIKVQRAGIR